ncbi:MAG TPA: DNA mismatch repair endonuclease MutL [Acidobacteriaceae bacterium]
MGRIRVLSDQVANQIAAGEVVDRPASVVKELLENSLDAGATRIRVEVEAGGRKLIRITDNGCGMNRDDALLAFERHATSKLRTADDLLSIATLGFRGEALPSIASVSRVLLETCDGDGTGTRIEIAGGRMLRVEDVALPHGTSLAVQDLFFNTPARRKFLRAESTELAHVVALVTHYALVHPEKHFELLSATHTLLQAPPVNRPAERIYQIFGAETLEQLLPVAAEAPLERPGLPEPPPWKRDPEEPPRAPGTLRLSGFFSKPELQKLNRNSIYIFVNKRLIRDRLLLHAISETYRNIIPPTSFPVVLLFLEIPAEEVDVHVHPAKTEVRFRQQNLIHDFVRDSLRAALVQARPAAGFLAALESNALASPSLMPPPAAGVPTQAEGVPAHVSPPATLQPDSEPVGAAFAAGDSFQLQPPPITPQDQNLPFLAHESPGPFDPQLLWQAASAMVTPGAPSPTDGSVPLSLADTVNATVQVELHREQSSLNALAGLKPLGQLRDSFILAVSDDGLWIIDQHVAHERVLFEKILASRETESVQRQRLLMPVLVELQPWQMAVFADIADELDKNGFEAEPFGPRTLAVKAAPPGLEGRELERMLMEVIEQTAGSGQTSHRAQDLSTLRGRIAASIACHAAIKVNMPLESQKMDWLLKELSKTEHPTSCPHGRPIALRYSWKEIQRAFQRI